MGMPSKGLCGTCGFFSKRAAPVSPHGFRLHSGFYEVEPPDRKNPVAQFSFVAGDSNALHIGEFACFRHKANLSFEISEIASARQVSEDSAARETVWKDRSCEYWCAYEPGLAPGEHLMELKTLHLEQDRKEFQLKMLDLENRLVAREGKIGRQLTKFAIILGVIIGLAQIIASILAMTHDSVGYKLIRYLF